MNTAERRSAPLPTPSELQILAARVMQIAEMTMRKYNSLELEVGSIEANAKVAKSLFDKATGPGKEGVTAAIFWLKARARWKETAVTEHAGQSVHVILTKEDMDL